MTVYPTPPTDEERDSYFARHVLMLLGAAILGMSGIVWTSVHLALRHHSLGGYLVLVAVLVSFFFLTAMAAVFSRSVRAGSHRHIVSRWGGPYPSVDVWLPVCGEPLEVLRNSWAHVAALAWPGELRIYVGDDAGTAVDLAADFRFDYAPGPQHMKKAGNLRALYARSKGNFIAIFDADFCPRPDFLYELIPYMDDPRIGIVQAPQFFRVLPEQGWLERGAGAVQELFYRFVQTSRQHHGGAICVGTNAVYRRAALDTIGGTALIEHSEDVHTGFDLRREGWDIRYVPVVLATGMCPDNIDSFMRQQYRWCMGSMSLLRSHKFWHTQMPILSRCCYISGFGYYVTTAMNTLLMPILPIILLLWFPQTVHLQNYLFLLPALVYSYIIFPAWHRCRWGLEAWTVQMLYGWSHLFAFVDIVRKRPMGWHPTGAGTGARKSFKCAVWGWSGGVFVLWLGLAAYRFATVSTVAFLPMLLLSGIYAAVVLRATLCA